MLGLNRVLRETSNVSIEHSNGSRNVWRNILIFIPRTRVEQREIGQSKVDINTILTYKEVEVNF